MDATKQTFAVGTGYGGRVILRTADREYLISSEEALDLAEELLDVRAELEPVDLSPVARPVAFDMVGFANGLLGGAR